MKPHIIPALIFTFLIPVWLATNFLLSAADAIVANSLSGNEVISYRDVIQSLIASLIWIPYLNVAQRVKETFVIRINHGNNNDHEVEEQVEAMDALR